jgi:putative NADPH-quinone reductase
MHGGGGPWGIAVELFRRNARRRILVLDGHPDPESLVAALARAYAHGARASGAEVRELAVRDLTFEMNLQHGYRKRTELEPDLLAAQDSLRWAEHLVVLHPVWWGACPALLKGFFDRVLLPGFFFKKRPGSIWWDKLLTGRSGRIIYTLDTPRLFWWLSGRPSYMALKYITLGYCGVSPIRGTALGIVRLSTPERRARWLTEVERLGARRG